MQTPPPQRVKSWRQKDAKAGGGGQKHRANAVDRKPKNKNKGDRSRKPKNTESFEPREAPPTLNMVVGNRRKLRKPLTVRDVVFTPDLFCDEEDFSVCKSPFEY